ncbi:MAG: class II aldolase/adducin family protein [Candidatus Dormibacteraeota bacterium]|nr:class II aldolase/adducin family protein [Candidatus Dormibacteraeota bacterium]MBO0762833.1 class II aldolase/adducin family protein [Candidatus Dormibacteraeota bacterium]
MTGTSGAVGDLVAANRILGHEAILDAYGHVSVRHPERPDRFLLSRPGAGADRRGGLLEHGLDGEPVREPEQPPYIERFIHAAVYESRPDVMAVCHNHTLALLPFTISAGVPLTRVIHSGRVAGPAGGRGSTRPR